MIGRFLIYYRDNAKWLERTYDFVPRVGIETAARDHRERLARHLCDYLDDEVEKTIAAYVDPWLERDKPGVRRPVRGRADGAAAGAVVTRATAQRAVPSVGHRAVRRSSRSVDR